MGTSTLQIIFLNFRERRLQRGCADLVTHQRMPVKFHLDLPCRVDALCTVTILFICPGRDNSRTVPETPQLATTYPSTLGQASQYSIFPNLRPLIRASFTRFNMQDFPVHSQRIPATTLPLPAGI